MHGGYVTAISPGKEQGSTFTVTLPLAAVHEQTFAGKTERAQPETNSHQQVSFDCPPQLNGLRVLVVDDETDARELLKNVLEQCNVEVITASSASEAFKAIEESSPHIIVSDIGMPGEDGYDLIRKIRGRERENKLKRIPAVALTAYARVEDRMRALSEGFQMHVPKPVEPAELAAVIANLANWETS
jgi:CheY-like chemotaxis protein